LFEKRSELESAKRIKDIVACFQHFEDCKHSKDIVLEFEDSLIIPRKKTESTEADQLRSSQIILSSDDYEFKNIFLRILEYLKSNSQKKADYQSILAWNGLNLKETLIYKNNI